MPRLLAVVATAALSTVVGISATSASTPDRVVVPRGASVRIALAVPVTGDLAPFGTIASNAVRLAIEDHPRVRGFRIVPLVFDAPCSLPEDQVAAQAIVADATLVGVVGPLCSDPSVTTLPTYEQAGIVVVSPTATRPGLGAFAPSIFNRTAVDDTAFNTWYARVATLPVNIDFRARFENRFGPPALFADLAYDATLVLLDALKHASTVEGGSLVIDRSTLAAAVRATKQLHGVTCTISFEPDGDRIDDPTALDRCAED